MVAVFGLGHWELVIILVIALLLFGSRLPDVARNLGKGIVEFKKGVRGIENDVDREASKKLENPPDSVHSPPAPPADAKSERTPSHGQD